MSTTGRTRVKICGLTSVSDLELAVDAGADAVGVVSEVPVETPREVASERAAEILAAAPPFVTSVLVTMPETPAAAVDLAERADPDVLQIHTRMAPADLETVAEATGLPVVLAVDADDLTELERYDGVVDALLVDSVDADGGGGTGETHDWERTREATAALDSPVVLAGGLTPENVTDAVATVDPFAVDVASGVEARGGVKDDAAVYAFVERAQTARPTSTDSQPTDSPARSP
ncbi:phosphoribosylanthranilate isomerase [Natronobiforma cellulositropha]|uniref:phosphoribosylanthranilate isomerase n=1 Tax=Natronobiforma cellulositropha TaxID=1679076 RepID=UPI0021D592CE|nr:phosphoribosylanthranilate isomerase [Natronobiforma cellulositropha]